MADTLTHTSMNLSSSAPHLAVSRPASLLLLCYNHV